MPRMYPASVRRQIVIRLRSGESVAAITVDTGICQATLFRWKRQALIDSGVIEGIASVEADELAAAHRRIAALEAELALTRDACELFNDEVTALIENPQVCLSEFPTCEQRSVYRLACAGGCASEAIGRGVVI